MAPDGQDGVHDDKETVDSSWVRPAAALAMLEAGDLMMMPPTIKNLRWLSGFATADDAVAAGAEITDPRVRGLADDIIYAQDKEIAEMRYPFRLTHLVPLQ